MTMEITALMENAILPDGVVFKDWGGGMMVQPVPESGRKYLITSRIGLTNGKGLAIIEFTHCSESDNGVRMVDLASTARAIDAAILQLN